MGKYIVYDLETYPNIFTFCACNFEGDKIKVFEISDRKNQLKQMLDFLRYIKNNGYKMVGFNNIGFDYPVLHYILEKAIKAKRSGKEASVGSRQIYAKVDEIIKGMRDGGFGKTVNPNEVLIPQIDLFKIHHFDNKARMTSLKAIQFAMRSDTIEDLPFPVGSDLTDDEKDTLIKYNKHDVLKTLDFFKESLSAVEFRDKLTAVYGFDCTNLNDTKIGKQYFIDRLEAAIPESCYTMTYDGKRVMNQTKRDVIRLKDVIFPYVKFERPEFNAILNWFKRQKITETKGVFTDILENELGDVAKYAKMRKKRQKLKGKPSEQTIEELKQKYPAMWINEVPLKSKKGAVSYWYEWNICDSLNVVIDDLEIVFGVGGVHAARSNTIVTNENACVESVDVASMYPNIAISNDAYPKHLGKPFCKIYKDVYNERKKYAKGTPENAVMKLALNGVYGDSNNQYSPFYDPQYTMSITINGQLSLCMLVDMLLKVPTVKIVMMNTDGIEYTIDKKYLQQGRDVCKMWESIVKLELEGVEYQKMYIRDVNNYVSISTSGKVKRKGAYEYAGLGWHQNHSSLVIPKAVEYELLGKGSADEFIRGHTDIYDFMLCVKVPRNSMLVVCKDGVDTKTQNICRYYACKDGGELIKLMPPLKGNTDMRRLSVEAGWNVKVCNNMIDYTGNIDYDFYIAKARKLIDCFYGAPNDEKEVDDDTEF